ncbi:nucleotidyltransferase family protein [Virgibacillus natechei]|uniref:nucleotidyltransferase family protein n=1 Tax=Virgibacillus sp. CBA3643 TaxID=2942278 RepID=UPI0035A38577
MFGIQETVYHNLMNYFTAKDTILQVILFGSRAKNTASFRSDIDLCIVYNGNTKASIKEDIDELVGIYSCDIVFTDQLNSEMKKQIERDGIVIYRKDRTEVN